MPNKIKAGSPAPHKFYLTIILFSYAIFALIFGFAYRYAVNPDGISELRLAGYIAEGHFKQSVTSGWSPLITWITSPFIFLGFDGLTAARISIAVCGAGLLLSSWFLALRFDMSIKVRFVALLITALLISLWTIQFISSDILIAALTVCYIYLVTGPDILSNIRVPFFCGIVGGISYLAHHYAFPFFLAHFPSMLFLRGYADRDKEGLPLKKIFISWGAGITGFLIIASIWIGIMSVKYGNLTISSKGGAAHAAVGPKDMDRRHSFFVGGLYKPKDAYAIHVFEDPSDIQFKTWSPFESKAYFIYQLNLIKENIIHVINHFVRSSPFFSYFFITGVLILVPVAILLNPPDSRKKFLYAWVIITFSIYCSGFLLIIARSPRRFYALMIIFLLISFHFIDEIINAVSDIVSVRARKLLICYLLIMVVSAFALKPGMHLLKSLKNIITAEQVNPYREIADQIGAIEFPGPYAVIRSSQKPTTDYYIAYFLKKQLLGRPLSQDAEGLIKELKAADAKSLIVFDNLNVVEELKKDGRFIHVASQKLKNSKRYESAVNIVVQDHEIITGWDSAVNIFTIRQSNE